MMDSKEISALIRLLDDTDAEVFEHIEGRLLSLGREVIPLLEDAWSHSFDALLQERLERIIHKIQFDTLAGELKAWKEADPLDKSSSKSLIAKHLFQGAVIIAKYQYPDLDQEKLWSQIEQIRKDVWIELNDNLTALEAVRVLNHIFFDIHGFSGNTTNYHAPQNSFINIVLEG